MARIDYTSITELPGSGLSPEQWTRIHHRYALAYDLAQDKRVLDVACGAGVGLTALAKITRSIAGGDYTMSVLEYARRQAPSAPLPIALTQFDAHQLPFISAGFDLILFFEAVYYLHAPEMFFREARRILAPGGSLLLGTENPDWPAFTPGWLSTRYWNVPELSGMLHQNGFNEIHCLGAFPVAAYSARQRWLARVRRYLAARGLTPKHPLLRRALQRIGYGKMTALPPGLEPATLERPAAVSLPVDKPNADYKVFYLHATVS